MPDIWMDVDAALSEVPVNILPLIDDTDFKSREVSVAYNATGMDLVWNFVTTGGAFTQTAVTPTTGGAHDWTHQGDGIYTIEIPASGGTINNDTEGFGWFSGLATGVLPWRGPTIGFRASGLNDLLIDSAYSATRGLAGTALPAAAADAAGGLPISDAGGLDIDAVKNNVASILADTGTDGVVLANDAITSAKYDESTAFPVKSADTGATQIARVGADGDTLETLSDQVDLQATAAKLLAFVQLLARKDAAIETDNATELGEINADGGSGAGAFSAQTDSQEALQAEHDTTQTAVGALENLSSTDVQAVIETNKLDHLVAVADADDAVDDSIVAKLAAASGDWSDYSAATHSLEALQAEHDDTQAALATVDGIVDAILLDTAEIGAAGAGLTAIVLSAAVLNQIADALLRRNTDNVEASSDGDTVDFRSLLGAVSKLTNKVAISGSTLSVYKSDDSTPLGTQTLTTNASADPITAADTD